MSLFKVTTLMKKYYDKIAVCDKPVSERTKIDSLLKDVKSSNQHPYNVVTIGRGDPIKFNTFNKTVEEFSRHIAALFRGEDVSSEGGLHRAKRSASTISKNKNVDSKGFKPITKNKKPFFNVVNVTNLKYNFNNYEWNKITTSFKTDLCNSNHRSSVKRSRSTSSTSTDATSTTKSKMSDETMGRIISNTASAIFTRFDAI